MLSTRFLILLFTSLFCSLLPAKDLSNGQTHKRITSYMGSRYELTAISSNKKLAWKAIEKACHEIERIENDISSWKKGSLTSRINRNAGKQAIHVTDELFYLIKRSIRLSKMSKGAFDISFAGIDKIWKFDGSMKKLPEAKILLNSVRLIDYKNIILDEKEKTVFLKKKGMKIGFGAIGKGYAAEKAKSVMKEIGIKNGLVNAGGDLIAWGTQENSMPWKIQVADPKDPSKILSWLEIRENAVVTSGNYERFAEINGKKYCHIIHPATGYPVEGIKSVTIICKNAELADALATTVFVMGEKKGLALINDLKGIECFLVNDQNEIKASSNLQLSKENSDEVLD